MVDLDGAVHHLLVHRQALAHDIGHPPFGHAGEAALKYLIYGGVASGAMIYGMSWIYGLAGSLDFHAIHDALAGSPQGASLALFVALVLTLAGLGYKVAAFPFHAWAPDVYEGAPTPVTAFFASAPKVAALGLGLRVAIEAMGPADDQWRQIVIFAALASILLGAVAAIGQRNIKRLLAYSSINNVGFALIGLAAGTPEGVASVLVDLVAEGRDGRTGDCIQLWAGPPTVLPPPMLDGILCAADLARAAG